MSDDSPSLNLFSVHQNDTISCNLLDHIPIKWTKKLTFESAGSEIRFKKNHSIPKIPLLPSTNSMTNFSTSVISRIILSNFSSHSMKNQGSEDLLKNLSGSDPFKMVEEIDISIKSSDSKNKQNFLRNSNDQEDKAKIGQMTMQLDEKGGQGICNQQCLQAPLTHICDCKVFGKDMYCPKYCVCYNKPERCSKEKCCLDCYEVKQQRLKFLLEEKDLQLHVVIKKPQVDVGIYIEGVKKQPKKFREEKCQCRNSRCENKYCVCFTAGNKCTVNCLCENCKNTDFVLSDQSGIQKKSKIIKPYLESSNNDSLSQKMEFQPPELPF